MIGPFAGIDEIPNRYRFATLVFRRARRLQGGAPPLMPPESHNCSRVAQQEAMAGLLDFSVPAPEIKP